MTDRMSNADKFERGLSYLKDYKATHGDCDVRQVYRAPDGYPLGIWVTAQRQKWQDGNLEPARIKALEEIGLDRDPRATQFAAAIERLKRYKATFGHTRVPPTYVAEDGYALGQWLSRQLRDCTAGSLSEVRRTALEAVGCELGDNDDKDRAKFEKGLAAVLAFRERNGHLEIDGSHKEGGLWLGRWLNARRRSIRAGQAPAYQIEAFREHGIHCPAPGSRRTAEQAFSEAINRIRLFKERFGHVRVPCDYVCDDGYKLGQWVYNCRRHWRKGNVRPERIAVLEELGICAELPHYASEEGIAHLLRNGAAAVTADAQQESSGAIPLPGARLWEARERAFSEAIERLKGFKDMFGHLHVPVAYVSKDGFKLGQCLASYRHQWRNGKLRPERVTALECLGLQPVLPPADQRVTLRSLKEAEQDLDFNRCLDRLKEYKAEFGDANVHYQYVTADGYRLGTWVQRQRRSHEEGKMPGRRIAALLAIGFDFEQGARRQGFDRALNALLAFRNREGHSNVPVQHEENGVNLGTWLLNRWKAINAGKAPKYQVDAFREHGLPLSRIEASYPSASQPEVRQELTPDTKVDKTVSVGSSISQRKVRLGLPRDSKVDKKAKREAVTVLSGMVSEALGKLANWADDDLISDRVRVRKELAFIVRPLVRERIGSLNDAFPIMEAIDFDAFARTDVTMMDAIWEAAEDWILRGALAQVDKSLRVQEAAQHFVHVAEPEQAFAMSL